MATWGGTSNVIVLRSILIMLSWIKIVKHKII